jgi:hypothetical protein
MRNKKDEEKTPNIIVIDLTMKKRKLDFYLDLTEIENSVNHTNQVQMKDIDFSLYQTNQVFPHQNYDAAIAAAVVAAPAGVLPPAILGMPAMLAAIQANVAALQANVAAIQANVAALQADVTVMKEDLALANNRGCSACGHPIRPRQGILPGPPPNFPPTLGDLLLMSGPALAPWLQYYGLGVGGSLTAKRRRLAIFLGIPQHMVV